jgi:hypothetical protein
MLPQGAVRITFVSTCLPKLLARHSEISNVYSEEGPQNGSTHRENKKQTSTRHAEKYRNNVIIQVIRNEVKTKKIVPKKDSLLFIMLKFSV